jgi:hypothetical protein
MRKFLLGLLGFAAIGFGAVASQPAEAQPYYPGYRYGPPPVEYRARRDYRPAYYPGRPAYYPARPAYYGGRSAYYGGRPRGYYRPVVAPPRCFVRMEQAWNGWRWVRQPVRVCR